MRELRAVAGPDQLAEEITALRFLDRYDHAQLPLDEVRSDCSTTARSPLPAIHCVQKRQDFNLGHSDDGAHDHLISLQLGGAPNHRRHLWVEPTARPRAGRT